jgi:hypothetical protein
MIGQSNSSVTLTISGLTVGTMYEFQWWSVGTALASAPPATATAGNSVTLDPNVTDTVGGLGQFAIGAFTANATTQLVTFSQNSVVDAVQLRQITQPIRSVPESGPTLGLFGLVCAGLVLLTRKDNLIGDLGIRQG